MYIFIIFRNDVLEGIHAYDSEDDAIREALKLLREDMKVTYEKSNIEIFSHTFDSRKTIIREKGFRTSTPEYTVMKLLLKKNQYKNS